MARRLRLRPLLLLGLGIAAPAAALQAAAGSPARGGARSPLAARAEAPRARPAVERPTLGADALRPDAARELAALGWEALVDPSSGHALRVFGAPAAVTATDPVEAASAFLASHPALAGVRDGHDGYELVPREPVRAGRTTVVRFDERWHGFPVEGVRADVRLAGGAPVMARLHLADGIDAPRAPSVAPARAIDRAREAVLATGCAACGPARLDEARPLVIVRGEDGWRLAWAVRVDAASPPARRTVWIDAAGGEPIAVRDAVRSGAAVDTPLSLAAWHEPRRAGDPLVLSPLPFFHARDAQALFVTDTAGMATVPVTGPSRTLDVALEGAFVSVVLWSGSSASAVQVASGVPASFAWDAQTAGLSERDAARSHAVVRDRMKRMAPDLPWLEERIRIVVDVPDANGCNAFWDGSGAQFFAESDTCNALARIADVVYHELGHGFHSALAGDGFTPGDVGEGSSDYLAATITGDPDIGPSFFKDRPEGLRNLEPDLVYPDDLLGEPHHDGLIWGGAFWDLRKALVERLGASHGVEVADRIFADTLRFDPVMEDGFWDVLLAADDDGNVSDGGPYECEVVAAFGAHGLGPGDGLAIAHLPLGAQSADLATGYVVRAHIASAFPRCGATGVTAAELEWRLAGEAAWRTIPMAADLVPGWRAAVIPPAPDGARVEYRLRATDARGRIATAPDRTFDLDPFRFPVGERIVVFEDDFETDRGWTHELVEGQDLLGADDWQRGAPRGRAGDPTYAFSGANVWGNDLGNEPFNGAYQSNVRNRLVSPVVDCRRCEGAKLQFRRWLTVEESAFDVASVWIGDRKVWSNPATRRVRDREWRFEEIDIAKHADGERFRIRFELRSDGGIQMGGWNIDDVRVTSEGTRREAGCGCSLEGGAAQGAWGFWTALGLLAIAVRRR